MAQDDKELFPGQRTEVVAAVEPPPPTMLDLVKEPCLRCRVSRNPVVRIMSAKLLVELLVLCTDREKPIVSAPVVDTANRWCKAIPGGLKLDDPVLIPRTCPEVSESQDVKSPRTIGRLR